MAVGPGALCDCYVKWACCQAKTIRDRLKERKSIGAHDTLVERLRLCEAADVVRQKCENPKDLKAWPLASLTAHLKVLERFLSEFPVDFMVRVSFRGVQEGAKEILSVSKDAEEPGPTASIDDFRLYVQAVDLQLDTLGDAAEPWNGLNTSISGVLALLIEKARTCEDELATSGDGLAELDVESALQAAEENTKSDAVGGLEHGVQACLRAV